MAIRRMLPAKLRVLALSTEQQVRDVVAAVTQPRQQSARRTPRRRKPRVQISILIEKATTPVPEPQADLPFIVLQESGIELRPAASESILDAALRSGIELDYSCRLGGCGACMLEVVEGEVGYEDEEAICLDVEEMRRDGVCLACVGIPRGRVVLKA